MPKKKNPIRELLPSDLKDLMDKHGMAPDELVVETDPAKKSAAGSTEKQCVKWGVIPGTNQRVCLEWEDVSE